MHISEITIDGFKSYATRVVVPGFDPRFNAITGLNGSGKSNILDAICFVLGITNLSQVSMKDVGCAGWSGRRREVFAATGAPTRPHQPPSLSPLSLQVRANTLQELVYKQGQAGVTKATVSVVFDNSDKATSPAGYEHVDRLTVTRQLVVGGRTKYLVNGHVAQPPRVANLFHSVGLNVNNPHFLIMQGRITKVLNMKPVEILGMLEEAAGTRMYETKKDAALRTLARKQVKVDEIDRLLAEEISPALTRLGEEREAYLAWRDGGERVEGLRRFCAAFKWSSASEAAGERGGAAERLRADVDRLAEEAAAADDDAAAAGRGAADAEAARGAAGGSAARARAAAADAATKTLARERAAAKHAGDAAAAEEAAAARAAAAAGENDAQGAAERAMAARVAADAATAAASAAEEAVLAAERALAGARAGDGRDGSNRSLAQRAADARVAATDARAARDAARVRIQGLQERVVKARAEVAARGRDDGAAAAGAAVARAEAAFAALGFDVDAYAQLQADAAATADAASRAADAAAERRAALAGLDFRYTPPSADFDPASVLGPLARLVRVTDPSAAPALEVVAGSRLFQVVVADDAAARALLSKGRLRSRTTLVPLNRVRPGRPLAPAALRAAAAAGPGAAVPALDLVACDRAVDRAAAYAFGGAFVAADRETATRIAFGPRDARARCVTRAGDDFNPGGTLTGGSRAAGGRVLAALGKLAEAERAEVEARDAAKAAARALDAARPAAAAASEATAALDLAKHARALVTARAAGAGGATAALADAEAALAAAVADEQSAAAAEAAALADADALDREAVALASNAGAAVAAAEAALEGARAAVGPARAAARDAAREAEAATAAAEAAQVASADAGATLAAARARATAARAAADAAAASEAAAAEAAAAASAALEEHRQEMAAADAGLRDLLVRRDAAAARGAAARAARAAVAANADAAAEAAAEAATTMARLEAEYDWIAPDKASFGAAGGPYDFSARPDPTTAFTELSTLEAAHAAAGRSVNRRVLLMYDRAQAEHGALAAKKEIVEGDRAKIQAVIAELDAKKRDALAAAWAKVNADFGAIMGTLLPGVDAKLEPPAGETFLDGLAARVAFNGVWKESLTELSGGQRSLLALSLILAMLRFKPAPLYILDEVDAALDLSHTQNVGAMIRAHFPQSQFVIVSLKEGMFSNAAVLFRTRFVDGVSSVTRGVGGGGVGGGGGAAAGKAGARPGAARAALTDGNAREEGEEEG
jgi:structural maintenance of chromosome 2